MKKFEGNLRIEFGDTRDFSQLEEVTGYLSVSSNVTLPQLTSVGGYLYVSSNVTFEAPQLTSVGGDLFVSSNVTLNIKFLNKVNYIVADGKAFLIESQKTSKGITIYSGFNIKGVKNCKVTKHETIYLASKDNFFAHGETVKKSVEDLQFKIVSEKLKNEPIKKDTELSLKYYRALTGACYQGMREFLESNNIPYTITGDKEHPIKEVNPIKAIDLLPILEKSKPYGYDKFKKLITF